MLLVNLYILHALPVNPLVITGEVITMEMGPGSQEAKNTIGPDLRSFLGIRLSGMNSVLINSQGISSRWRLPDE